MKIDPLYTLSKLFVCFFLLALANFLASSCYADDAPDVYNPDAELPQDLTAIGLENLLKFNMVVTSPSKKEQKIADVASAIYVVTQDDIRRSGATHVAEVLRLVPGINVARISANQWAVSARGFNSRFEYKLLVQVDGRSIFNLLTNGVYWEIHELPLEDIDRIEVIRGPGSAIWGLNAVNGVINIITKRADKSLGSEVTAGGGLQETFFTSVRNGVRLSETSAVRTYARFNERGSNHLHSGGDAQDDWSIATYGVRADSKLSDSNEWTFLADGFHQSNRDDVAAPTITPPFVDNESFSGQRYWNGINFSSILDHKISATESTKGTLSYGYDNADISYLGLAQQDLNAEVEQRIQPLKDHDLVYGVSYRYYQSVTNGTYVNDFDPPNGYSNFYSFFANDELQIIPNKLHFIFGGKLADGNDIGVEFMPTARALWTHSVHSSSWVAVSKAISNPYRVAEDVIFPAATIPTGPDSPALIATIIGNKQVKPEEVIAYELGHRTELTPALNLDLALFYNDYDTLYTFEPCPGCAVDTAKFPQPSIALPLVFSNAQTAKGYGAEASLGYRVSSVWKMLGSYSYQNVDIDQGVSQDTGNKLLREGGSPKHQVNLRSQLDLPYNFEWDANYRFIDSLALGSVPSYSELDLRLGWRYSEELEFSLVAQNLLHDHHLERVETVLAPPATEINRAVFAKVKWNF